MESGWRSDTMRSVFGNCGGRACRRRQCGLGAASQVRRLWKELVLAGNGVAAQITALWLNEDQKVPYRAMTLICLGSDYKGMTQKCYLWHTHSISAKSGTFVLSMGLPSI